MVSDRKLPVDSLFTFVGSGGAFTLNKGYYSNTSDCYNFTSNATTGLADFYHAEVLTANDYYPSGMLMPERTYTNVACNFKSHITNKKT